MERPIIQAVGASREATPAVLYESATTRVDRRARGAASVICKTAIGPDAGARIKHERNMLGRLAGIPGIVQMAGMDPTPDCIALGDDGGAALSQALRHGPLAPPVMLRLAVQLAGTVAAMHRAGVIHRDLNPANILLAGDGVVLIDFDLAVPADGHAARPQAARVVGTLGYLAPEQTGRTGHDLDRRSDLYALGATFYEMATGRLPFDAEDTLQLIHQHLVREPTPPSQVDSRVPEAVSRVILRLLAKDPERRYQSAEGLLYDLEQLQHGPAAGAAFALGERDFPERLEAPAQLVGREPELAALREAFSAAMDGGVHTVLVEGTAGVGKSALLLQLRQLVTEAGGWFIAGKFDQYQREGATVGPVTQIARALGRLLLALPQQELAEQRARILAAVGGGASAVVRWLPEFALLLGEQPAPLDADPQQAETQLHLATVHLLGAVASPQRPLVVALDDLQWAGGNSLRGFERLMRDRDLRGLLLVAAYRGDEVSGDHVLATALARWRALPEPPRALAIGNLGEAGVRELVARMLRLPADASGDLAAAVRTLTDGNPYDTVEMVNALRREGVLRLLPQGWTWDAGAVRRFVGRGGNVVDLLAARLARLPQASRDALALMGLLGNAVDEGLLCAAAGWSQPEAPQRLRAAVEDGLLLPRDEAGGGWQFRHDRVQQAVLDAMGLPQREAAQLAMARRLAKQPAFEGEAAQQYLAVASSLGDPAERRLAAGLFHRAARTLAGTASYALVERYLQAADTLLEALGDPGDAPMHLDVRIDRHAALYGLGRLEAADPLYAAIVSSAADPIRFVEPTSLQMRSFFVRGQADQAMMIGLRLLSQLGLLVPRDFTAPRAGDRDALIDEWLRCEADIDHATRPQITDPRLLAIARLLGRVARPAVFSADPASRASRMFEWVLMESLRLWREHGPCPGLVASVGRLGAMLIALAADYRRAYLVARHVLAVGEALGWEPHTSEARFIFGGIAAHWFDPIEDAMRNSERAHAGIRAGGDESYAGFAHSLMLIHTLEVTPSLDAWGEAAEAGAQRARRFGNENAWAQQTCSLQMQRALKGRTVRPDSFDDAHFEEASFLARTTRLPYVDHVYAECRALHGLFMGDPAVLVPNARLGMSLAANLAGYYMTVYAHLCAAMAIAWQLQDDPAAVTDVPAALAQLDASRRWLAERAADQPDNFLHLLHLVEAEQAWAVGDLWKAAERFDAAVAGTRRRHRPWHAALIRVRAGRFLLARGMAQAGRELLVDACRQWAEWGADAVVARLRAEHDFLREQPEASQPPRAMAIRGDSLRGSGSVASDALDLLGVLRASQALSSETGLARLTAKVTEVLGALSGATHVRLLSWQGDGWNLVAPEPGSAPMPAALAADEGHIPAAVIAYVERTGEALLVDDVSSDDRFARDRYFRRVPACSLLVVPISSQGGTRAMVYLENRAVRAAFSAGRLDAVRLIAGQLAVSLANAQLYESLEERVAARTRELEQTQAQLVATARRAGKAEIANNVLHNVGNVLNSINVSTSMVRNTIVKSKLEGLARAVALMNEIGREDAGFMGSDARGKTLLAYLNELVAALGSEREHALADLDRLARSVEHITYVVASQQSHAGPSSVVESARPDDLLQEALHLCEETIVRGGVTVSRIDTGVPSVTLDRQRVVQILVNLIRNGVQAMGALPAADRELALRTQLSRAAAGDMLRITVRDVGEGIATEDLKRIFSHGFTTRTTGHGFGLHSSALAATEMGGRITAHSDGRGRGASFTLELPVNARPKAPPA